MPNKSVAITRRTAVESENEAKGARPGLGVCLQPEKRAKGVDRGGRVTYKCKTLNNFIFFARNAAPAQSES